MGNPQEKLISAEDACRIIEVCGKSNVSELRFRGIHVRFGRPTESFQGTGVPLEAPLGMEQAISPYPDTEISREPEPQNENSLLDEELRLKDERIAMALLENPAEAERLLLQGDLEDERQRPDDDEEA